MTIKKKITLFTLVGLLVASPSFFKLSTRVSSLPDNTAINKLKNEIVLSEHTSEEMSKAKDEVVDGFIFWINKLVFSFVYQAPND
tara:strand:- start:2777 stop:3031 length:255 start_codon:yes stop_codon:yes gene_type:complete